MIEWCQSWEGELYTILSTADSDTRQNLRRHPTEGIICWASIWRKENRNICKFRMSRMCTKIKAIYNSFIQETKGNDDASVRVQEKVQEVLREKKQELDWQEFEQYRDQIYEVSSAAEEAGFINGFKYAVMLMAECYARDFKTIEELW